MGGPYGRRAFSEATARKRRVMLCTYIMIHDTLNTLNAYQRIGSEGPSNYSGTMDATPGGGYTVNGIDYIWEETGKTEAEIIGEVIEHLLHTITTIGFNTSFVSEWFWNSTSSNVYLAMSLSICISIDLAIYVYIDVSIDLFIYIYLYIYI